MACPNRDVEGEGPRPGDPWAGRELLIKWRFYAYIHCSWERWAQGPVASRGLGAVVILHNRYMLSTSF